jgi:GNAT superfamily N-acetyltransferase
MKYQIHKDKNVSAQEFISIMESVGWGGDYAEDVVLRSIAAYPFIAHARNDTGSLVGYISAFSDGAFSTMLGELVVCPSMQGKGIGRALLSTVEVEFPDIPIYVTPLQEAKHFFLACGYRAPNIEMSVLFKHNTKTL